MAAAVALPVGLESYQEGDVVFVKAMRKTWWPATVVSCLFPLPPLLPLPSPFASVVLCSAVSYARHCAHVSPVGPGAVCPDRLALDSTIELYWWLCMAVQSVRDSFVAVVLVDTGSFISFRLFNRTRLHALRHAVAAGSRYLAAMCMLLCPRM
jgi:hypothetical protein